jgi:benzoylformate decarboxylase
MTAPLGREVLLDVLRTEGVKYLFGNPGSTELPLIDALAGADDLEYVLALQEATAVGMADGYAQVTGRPAFLNLHTSAGLGNAIGNLTNAQANGTPLVVTAGQQDYRHIAYDPLLSGDLVGLARGVSKWVHEIRTVDELAMYLRRAFHDAAAAPSGPVFVSLPMDKLDEEVTAPVPAPSTLDRRAIAEDLEELAQLLVSTPRERLAIIAGDEVSASGAVDALVAVAEALGVKVHGSPLHSTTVFPNTHPLWAGTLVPAAAVLASQLGGYDRVFGIGSKLLLVYPYTPGPLLPPATELLHLTADPHQLGRYFPTRFGCAGDPRATLVALLPHIRARVAAAESAAAVKSLGAEHAAAAAKREAGVVEQYNQVPIPPAAAAHALVRAIPPDTAVVDEAITTGGHVRNFHRTTKAGYYFFCKGGGLGWGMPAALGVSLGYDRSPVLCVVGDGSAMYSPQALWTAAREELPVVFAVVNNRQYLILKNYLRQRNGPSVTRDRFVAMDLDHPPIDYIALAESMGVAGTLVEKATDIGDAVQASLATGRPHLLEIPISAE